MARVTLKSQAIIIANLEAQVAELMTEKGILLNANQELQGEIVTLREALEEVETDLEVAKHQCARQSTAIAAQPKSVSKVESPTTEVNEDWSTFRGLKSEQKAALAKWAKASGVANVITASNVSVVRAAWANRKVTA